MKHPLLRVVVAYAAGVLFSEFFPLPLTPLLVAGLFLVGPCLAWPRARPVLLALVLMLAGAANLRLRTAILSLHDLRLLVDDRVERATLRGSLPQTPSLKLAEHDGEPTWRSAAELRVSHLRLDDAGTNWQPAFGRVLVSTPGALPPSFFAGREVEVVGRLRRPPGALAEGLFDYQEYLGRLGIYYQLQAVSTNDWILAANSRPRSPPLTDRFVAWGKTALARGLPVEDEALRLEWALTLGWKTALTEEVSEPFIRAATYHIFAVDGLRIAMVSGIFLSLMRLLGLGRAVSGLLVIPLVWFYVAMTGYPASAIRAAVMATVVFGGWALKRPNDLLNSLFGAAFILLLWEPAQLFQAGFQLSFLVVFCIILLMPSLLKLSDYLFRPDAWLPGELHPRWRSVIQRPGHYLRDIVLVSLAAWLGSIPLAAYYFHIFTPVSVPANVLAVPLCGLVLVCNLISLLLAGWFPWGAEIYNHAGWGLMECIRVTSHWSARWPAAYYYVPAPTLFAIGLYYVLLLALATGWVFKLKHRTWALGGLGLLVFGWAAALVVDYSTTRLTVLPCKGAAALFFDAPGQANDLLVDCGNENSAGFLLKPFLRGQGVNQLAGLALTHGGVNRAGGADLLRKCFSPARILASPVRSRSPAYRQFLEQCEAVPGLVQVIERGSKTGAWKVLHPAGQDRFSQADDNAVVLRGDIDGTRVLLLSSLGRAGQNALFRDRPDLRADVVIAGLPQQNEPLAEALLDAIQPRLIILADASFPASARANRKLRARLARRNTPILYTSDTGAITVSFHHQGWRIHVMNPLARNADVPEGSGLITDESP